jgi:excisionase family DNA binding protein
MVAPSHATTPEPYVGLSEAATFMGLSLPTLRKWRETGTMPFPLYAAGRRLTCRLSEVDAWVQSRTHRNAAELRCFAV